MKRNPSRPGLSYLDANKGRLITEGPDVLEIKHEIASRWPGVIEAIFDVEDEVWLIIEHCTDGTDRLAMPPRKRLDMSVIRKLQRIDQASHPQGEEINRQLEREDELADQAKDHALSEAIGDGAERLYWAMKKDGITERPEVFMSSGKKKAKQHHPVAA